MKIWELTEDELFALTKALPFNITVLTKTGKEKTVTVRNKKSGLSNAITYDGAEWLSIFKERELQIEKFKILTNEKQYL